MGKVSVVVALVVFVTTGLACSKDNKGSGGSSGSAKPGSVQEVTCTHIAEVLQRDPEAQRLLPSFRADRDTKMCIDAYSRTLAEKYQNPKTEARMICFQKAATLEELELCASAGVEAQYVPYARARFRASIRNWTSAEATLSLARIEAAAKKHFADTGSFCPSSIGRVPAVAPRGTPITATADDWLSETWKCLGFSMSGAQSYSYEFTSSGSGANAHFTATAYGDLTGMGLVTSVFILEGKGTPKGYERVRLYIKDDVE